MGLADQRLEALSGKRRQRIERDHLKRTLHVGELPLQPGERFAEETQGLEEPHDVRADPVRRTEVHDRHRYAPADSIEPADALFHKRRFPGRSNSIRRRQNSKLRPSPPHSVDTSRLGPSGSRNRATAEPLCFVHEKEIDSRVYGLLGQLRTLRQHFQCDDGPTMHIERVEVMAEVMCRRPPKNAEI